MDHERDRAALWRLALSIVGVAVGIVVLLAIGGWAMDAFLGQPVLEPAQPAPRSTASAPATAAPDPSAATTVAPAAAELEAAESEKKPAPTPAPAAKKPTKKAPSKTIGVVVIDPGHQGTGDTSTEPIGPGSSQRKAKVAYGATGVSTGKPESLINLQVSLKLRDELESRGVKVIMVRTKQDVNISNSERAKIANDANADLFIRVHNDSIGDSSRTGFSTLVPAKNEWTGPIVKQSGVAGRDVQRAAVRVTGARDRGIVPRSDMSGFNWAKVPAIIVEMGFMSNPAEDRKLATSAYQKKLAQGIAEGTVTYLKR